MQATSSDLHSAAPRDKLGSSNGNGMRLLVGYEGHHKPKSRGTSTHATLMWVWWFRWAWGGGCNLREYMSTSFQLCPGWPFEGLISRGESEKILPLFRR
jgi:hypothetical protein